jgi:hypothetical protein
LSGEVRPLELRQAKVQRRHNVVAKMRVRGLLRQVA